MKIKIQLAAILLLTIGFLSSCVMTDSIADCPAKGPLKVISTIDFGGGNALWPKGSTIGITLLKAGTNECFGDNSGKHYVIGDTQTGESVPGQSNDPIYLPDGEGKVDVVAYYPYTTPFDKNNNANLSVLDQSKPDLLDLITSDRVSNVPSDAELIELKFYRRLTRLAFNITLIEIDAEGNEIFMTDQLPGTSLVVTGMPVTGVYSLSDNKLSLDENVKDIITLMNQEGTKSSAIVFPRKAGEGVTFVVTLADGKKHTFLMSPEQVLAAGSENTFDIVIKYNRDSPAKPEYRASYELQGDLTTNNIAVKQGHDNEVWDLNETVIVKEGGTLTFRYNSDLTVTAHLSDGTILETENNKPYSFTNIKKDIHMIFSAKSVINPPTEPEKVYHKMTHKFVNGLSSSNVTITKGTSTLWPTDEVVKVEEGQSFEFMYQNKGGTVKSAVINEKIITDMKNNRPYNIENIRIDHHIIFGGVGNHEVKLWINLPDRDPVRTSTLVVHNGKHKFKIPILASEKIIMTIDGVNTEPTPDADGYYTIEGIQEDKVIIITVAKTATSPDAFITADIHEWTIRGPIDGGVVLPDKK